MIISPSAGGEAGWQILFRLMTTKKHLFELNSFLLKSPCNGNYRMNSCRCKSCLEELRVNSSFWQSMRINLIWLFCKAWNWLLLLLVHKETEHWPVGYHGGRQTIGGPRPLAGIVAWVFLRSAGWHRRHNNKERCSQCFLMKWFCAEAFGVLDTEFWAENAFAD